MCSTFNGMEFISTKHKKAFITDLKIIRICCISSLCDGSFLAKKKVQEAGRKCCWSADLPVTLSVFMFHKHTHCTSSLCISPYLSIFFSVFLYLSVFPVTLSVSTYPRACTFLYFSLSAVETMWQLHT